ncbi:MAG: hypothetical protein NVSMB70_18280 [Chamaesiphon sp.]
MLAYILAVAVGFGSFAIYMAAFFFPEVHRKGDFIWSGVGLFYALVLWVCAGRITGAVLLGQTASVALLGWFAWQTLTLRRAIIPVKQQTEIPSKEKLQEQLSNLTPPGGLSQVQQRANNVVANAKGWSQARLGAMTKRKVKPGTATTQQLTTPTTPDKAATVQTKPTATVEPTVVEELPLNTEPTPAPSTQPTSVDIPEPTPAPSTQPTSVDIPEPIPAPSTQPTSVDIPEPTPVPSTQPTSVDISEPKRKEPKLKSTSPGSLSQPQEQVTSLFGKAKSWIQGALGAITKRKDEPIARTTQKTLTPKKPDISVADQPDIVATVTEELLVVEVLPLGKEPTNPFKQPAGPDMPGPRGKEPIPVEEIAPEVELAPPAEPFGLGDPHDRQYLSSSQPESSQGSEQPKLVRPNPPNAEIVEAAIEDAESKSVSASPPEDLSNQS